MTEQQTPKGRTRRNPNNSASPRNLQRQERQLKAAELRKQGLSFNRIAEALGYADRSGAAKAVESVRSAARRNVGLELIAVEAEVLDEALSEVRAVLLGADDSDSVVKAANAIARLSESRRRLYGLDAPTRQDITTDSAPITVLFNPALAPMPVRADGGMVIGVDSRTLPVSHQVRSALGTVESGELLAGDDE